jgi:hypothetical protein
LTRGVDAVKDVFDRSGSKGGANVPSVEKAVSHWSTSPGVEEVGGEIGEAVAVSAKRLAKLVLELVSINGKLVRLEQPCQALIEVGASSSID